MKDGARCFGAYVVLLELIVPLHMEFLWKGRSKLKRIPVILKHSLHA